MAAIRVCDLCHDADSKYKCPTCGLRYCSLACYKPHKLAHEADDTHHGSPTAAHTGSKLDRPGTTQRVAKPKFNDFEKDAEFQRLLLRYPALKTELQAIFALTLDPGPEEARSWNKMALPMLDRPLHQSGRGGRGRGRGQRARGTTSRGARSTGYEPPEGREHGQWSKDKADREALYVMKKVKDEISDETLAEGLQEFVELVKMRFGDGPDGP